MEMMLSAALVALAGFSSLLTFAHLWQVKEWRIDRLREHLRAEGVFRQLFGIIRPVILGFFVLLGLLSLLPLWPLFALITFTAFGALQIGLKKQPYPVWTKKAIVLTASALLLTIGTFAILRPTPYAQALSTVLPLLQPLFLFASWLLFFPLDSFLKQRIMTRAKRLRAENPTLTVIGITGSVGKTTTKELLAHILQNINPIETPAYVNTEMGVSQWLIQKLSKPYALLPAVALAKAGRPTPQPLIVEMGAYRQGEIALLCEIVQPTIGVITFVGAQHISLFGSQQALCMAKAELLDAIPPNGHAFLNADNEHCEALRSHCACSVTTVGTGDADLEAFDIEETPKGICFRLGNDRVAVPIFGTHNVTNVLLAIAVAEKLGLSRKNISAMLQSYTPPKNTFSIRESASVTILDDTHNASPASFKAAIAWARTQPREKKILLTPGLIELGTYEDHIHTELGALAVETFDRVIFTNNHNIKAFEKGFKERVELISKRTLPVESDSLLVCIGRMSQQTISNLLPKE